VNHSAALPPSPFSTAPGGITYERGALQDWIKRKGSDPATGYPLTLGQLYSNLNLRDQICGFFLVREHLPDAAAPAGGQRARAPRAGGAREAPGGGDAPGGGRARPAASWQTQ
jgi:hypothetical protein